MDETQSSDSSPNEIALTSGNINVKLMKMLINIKDLKACDSAKEEDDCSVCMDKKRDVIFIPCGHITHCVDCVNNMTRQSMIDVSMPLCCVCRKTVEKIYRAYV